MEKIIFLLWFVFILVYSIGVNSTPIFEDEAEYLLLSDQIVKEPLKNFLIYLQNGIFPGFGWLVAVVTKFTGDSLIAGRILNIFLASSLVFLLAKIGELYKLPKQFSVISILLLIASPALLLNSRIALLDTSVLVFTAWYIYLTAKIIQEPKKSTFILLFLSVLFAFLIKPNAIFGLPAVLIIIAWNVKERGFRKLHLHLGLDYVLAIIIPLSFYMIFSRQINEVTGSSLMTNLSETIYQIKQNLFLTLHWSRIYYFQYLIPLLAAPFFYKSIKYTKLYIIMLIWIISVFIGMIALNRFYFPRHTLMLVLPLIVIAAGLVSELPKRLGIILAFIIIIAKIDLDWKITTSLENAPIALEDKFSYFENYTSGKTLGDISNTLTDLSKNEPIIVWLDGSYVMEYGLRRELKDNKNISFKSFRMDDDFYPHELRPVLKEKYVTTYALENRWSPTNANSLKLIKTFTVSFRHGQNLYLVP